MSAKYDQYMQISHYRINIELVALALASVWLSTHPSHIRQQTGRADDHDAGLALVCISIQKKYKYVKVVVSVHGHVHPVHTKMRTWRTWRTSMPFRDVRSCSEVINAIPFRCHTHSEVVTLAYLTVSALHDTRYVQFLTILLARVGELSRKIHLHETLLEVKNWEDSNSVYALKGEPSQLRHRPGQKRTKALAFSRAIIHNFHLICIVHGWNSSDLIFNMLKQYGDEIKFLWSVLAKVNGCSGSLFKTPTQIQTRCRWVTAKVKSIGRKARTRYVSHSWTKQY